MLVKRIIGLFLLDIFSVGAAVSSSAKSHARVQMEQTRVKRKTPNKQAKTCSNQKNSSQTEETIKEVKTKKPTSD